ncbi:hypothetical protein U14_01842 [Candidatus Moduliflexus flocculans]|uniref:Uncharacterized protein n=1 Tax=Candidatus Moduliflexus flocculans TaxID=1499966 RepID=A0A0S6VYE9_9BACT|nr:hypothetical protein U14_01842 [Candidatus Moduliflexus flocculans]
MPPLRASRLSSQDAAQGMAFSTMKRIGWLIIYGLAHIAVFPEICAANAFDYMGQSLAKVVYLSTILNLANYDYNPGNSLFGYYLDEGTEHGLYYEFSRNANYLILAAGDDDVSDLDISVMTKDGEEIVSDRDASPGAYVEFRPPYSGQFLINLKNYDSDGISFCSYVILKESGSGDFSLNDLVEALQNALTIAQVRALIATQFPRNRMILFGGRSQEGQSNSVYDIGLEKGQYVFLGSGSNRIRDVDITIAEQYRHQSPEGKHVCEDAENDNTPICEFHADSGEEYALNLKNYASRGDGFVFGVLLQD